MDDPIVIQIKAELAKSLSRTAQLRAALEALGCKEDIQPELALIASASNDLSDHSQVRAVYQILSESVAALSYDEIIEIAAKRGKKITKSSLPSVLSRNDNFTAVGGGRWTLTEKATVRE